MSVLVTHGKWEDCAAVNSRCRYVAMQECAVSSAWINEKEECRCAYSLLHPGQNVQWSERLRQRRQRLKGSVAAVLEMGYQCDMKSVNKPTTPQQNFKSQHCM